MAKKKAASAVDRKIKELQDYISLKQRVLDGLNSLSATERKFLARARKELKQLKKQTPQKVYNVYFVDPENGSECIGVFGKRPAAVKFIKEEFWKSLDTGDRLRRVLPNTFVHEPDYENTGKRATATNYEHMYHWTIEEVG